MATDGKPLYAPVSDFKFKVAMSGEAGARASIIGIPMLMDPNSGGGLFALDLATGKKIWHATAVRCHGDPHCSPAQTAPPTAIPGVVFAGSIDGHMRAYASEDGRELWTWTRKRPMTRSTACRPKAARSRGPGPWSPMACSTQLGYGYIGEAPGNVLLVYSVDGK